MQQRPNRPTVSSRPSDATRRPPSQPGRPTVHSRPSAGSGRPAQSGTSSYEARSRAAASQRPRLTRRQLEILRRRRRREKIRNIALLSIIVAVIVGVSAWILRPRDDVRSVVSRASAQPTVQATLAPTEVPAATEAPVSTEPPAATQTPENTQAPVQVDGATPSSGLRSAHFRVTGDLMVTDEQLNFAKAAGNGNGYNFMPSFSMIRESLQNADYTMGNLEVTVGKYTNSKGESKAYSGYPLFNCPETILDAAKDAGYDFFTLANNHMLDRWFDGMKNTVGWVEQYGFDHVGAYRTQEERNTPTIVEINGIKFGFVAYTHSTNTQERVCDEAATIYGVPYLYKADIEGDIQKLRAAGAEVVIAFPHWGDEYIRQPDSNQQKYAKKLAEAGADIILGSHSHTVQPMGYVNVTDSDGRQREVFVIFSMGNFLSTHTLQYTDSGVIIDFTVQEQADGTFKCQNVGYVPTYCWLTDSSVTIVPSGKYLNEAPAGMDAQSYARMKETYQETVEQMGVQFPALAS